MGHGETSLRGEAARDARRPTPSTSRLRVNLLPLALALASLSLVASGLNAREKPASSSSPSTDSVLRDIRLTVHARRALSEDALLARLNLGVKVRAGVATLRGPVPSADLIPRAVQKLQRVPGIHEVRSELYVSPLSNRDDPLLVLPLQPEPPTQTRSASPERIWGPLPTTLTGRHPAVLPGPEETPRTGAVRPSAPPGLLPAFGTTPVAELAPAVRNPVSLLAPVAITGQLTSREPVPPAPPAPSSRVSAVVERVRQADPRFRLIQTEVRGGIVLLRGGDTPSADVMAFAQMVSQLPGVAQVLVQRASSR